MDPKRGVVTPGILWVGGSQTVKKSIKVKDDRVYIKIVNFIQNITKCRKLKTIQCTETAKDPLHTGSTNEELIRE